MSAHWDRLRALPLTIDAAVYERQAATFAYGFERVTTLVRLSGGGAEGLGEDVSPYKDEDVTLHVLNPDFGLVGEWTLESFCDHLAATDQWAVAPEYDAARRWRNWAFESAALDLALSAVRAAAARRARTVARPAAVRQLARARRAADLRADRGAALRAPGAALQARRHG